MRRIGSWILDALSWVIVSLVDVVDDLLPRRRDREAGQ